MQKIILALLTIFTLQPLAAMESDGSKRSRTGESQPSPTSENLLKAAKEGNKAECEWLINEGVDVNSKLTQSLSARRYSQRPYTGNTPLITASKLGHYEVCKLLITAKANINAQKTTGCTALMSAAKNGHKEICELLITHGAQLNIQDNKGYNSLIHATLHHEQICKLLITSGADIHAKDNLGYTALNWVTRLVPRPHICRLLLKHGANTNALCQYGVPVLIDSIRADNSGNRNAEKIVSLLLKFGADVNLLSDGKQIDRDNPQKNTGSTALMEAISNGRSRKICEELLGYGADREYTNNRGESAITRARTRAAGGDEEDDGHNILTLLTNPSEMQKAMKKRKNPIFKSNLPGYYLKEETISSHSSPENSSEEEEEEEQKESQGDSKSICLALEERTIGM